MGSANPNTHWPWWFRHIAPIAAWPSPGQSRSPCMGWIQEGIRNLSERLEDAEDDQFFENFRKLELRQRERLLKMEHLAKMEASKDAGTGRILGGVRNLFGRLDKEVYDLFGRLVDDGIEEDSKKILLRVQAEMPAKMQALKLRYQSPDKKAVDDLIDEDCEKILAKLPAKMKDYGIEEDSKKILLRVHAEMPAKMQALKLWYQSPDKKALDDLIAEDCEKILAKLPAKMKAWKRRIHRLDKRREDWGRDYRKWIDGDFKKISRGTLELELRRLQLERMQVEFLQRRLQPTPYCMVSAMMSPMPYHMMSGMMSPMPYHMMLDDAWPL